MSTSLNTPSSKPPVILLVEDESMVREITGQVLSHAGYAVLESSNAKEALQIANSHLGRIDLLLTDIVMPEMNGADLAQRMLHRQPDLVTVFMSGYAEHDLLKKAKLSSAVHIQKPFTVDALLSRVSEALNEPRR
jgi:DNA-binding NtrC family response regulator